MAENSFKLLNIPNALTCCNLISGCIATSFAFAGQPLWALLWIIIGAVFDFFDGMSARLLKVSSPIGKELDSLADDVTFGVAPSTMIFWYLGVLEYPAFLQPVSTLIPFLAYIMAAFSALRLAKFNLDTRQTTSFIGLPTPANALFWGSLIVISPSFIENSSWGWLMILILAGVSSYLLICEMPMFALKFKQWGWKGNELKYCFAIFTFAMIILFCIADGVKGVLEAWMPIILVYVVLSALRDLHAKKQ